MAEFFSEYGLFLLKTLTLVIAILVTAGGVFALGKKSKTGLTIKSLSDELDETRKLMHKDVRGKKLKIKKSKTQKPTLFVVDFDGDIKASQVSTLREEITAILTIASPEDEIMIRLESPGGMVNGYGLAASQLQRIRDRKIPLTVCIDKVAASGGYLMAAVANTIIAAPFSIIGSIGVVAQLPNFHRFLKNHNIDVELLTAGQYKRTLTVFGENTKEGRQKFQEDLEKIHTAFRTYVLTNRVDLPIDEVATGEHWLASDALQLKLVDKLQTSDDWMLEKHATHQLISIDVKAPTSFSEKILKPATKLFSPF